MAILSWLSQQRQAEIGTEREKERRALCQSYLLTFSSPSGERVLRDLIEQSLVEEPFFGPRDSAPIDPIRLGSLEGRRQMLLYIQGMIAEARFGPPEEEQEPAAKTF